jgi:UDP-N-acetyl-D-mannosaminuronate dehydrogenase
MALLENRSGRSGLLRSLCAGDQANPGTFAIRRKKIRRVKPPTLEKFDVILIAANHSSVNYHELGDWVRCIVDSRNAMTSFNHTFDKVWKA